MLQRFPVKTSDDCFQESSPWERVVSTIDHEKIAYLAIPPPLVGRVRGRGHFSTHHPHPDPLPSREREPVSLLSRELPMMVDALFTKHENSMLAVRLQGATYA
jgi:hypothetical protein